MRPAHATDRLVRAQCLRLEVRIALDVDRPGRDAIGCDLVLRELARQQKGGGDVDPQVEQFRWLLEELRVQLFAQELKTPVPVSVKRLQKMWQSMLQ